MSNSTRIGGIHVDLGLGTAKFDKGVAKARKEAAGLGASLKSSLAGVGKNLFTPMAAAATAAVAPILSAAAALGTAKAAMSEFSKTGDVAARLGVDVERLQELRFAAEQGGMAVDNFDVAFRRFIRRSSSLSSSRPLTSARARCPRPSVSSVTPLPFSRGARPASAGTGRQQCVAVEAMALVVAILEPLAQHAVARPAPAQLVAGRGLEGTQRMVQVLPPAGHGLGQPGVVVDAHREVRVGHLAAAILEEIGQVQRGGVRAALEHLEVQR